MEKIMVDEVRDSRIDIAFALDGRGIALWASRDGKQIGPETLMGADAVDELIQNLALMRSRMTPPVAEDYRFREEDLLVGCDFIAIADGSEDRRHFAVRHPGYGWLAFELSWEAATELATALLHGQEVARH